jgi:hypothetical protein
MFLFLLSEHFTVTDANFYSILSQHSNRPLLLKVTHPGHSTSPPFSDSWSSLFNNPPNISLGEFVCSDSSTICPNLTEGNYPASVWLEPEFNVSVYSTSTALNHFIEEMLVYPFTLGKDWEYARSRSDPWTPQVLATVPQDNWQRVFPVLKKVFCLLKTPVVVRWKSPPEMQVLRAGFKEVSFHGRWTEDELVPWLKRALIPRCVLLTDEIMELLAERGRPVVHLFIDPDTKWADFWPWIQLFPPFQYTYLRYDPNDPFVEWFRARGRDLPSLIYYIPGTDVRIFHTGEVKPQDVGDWLAGIEDWALPATERVVVAKTKAWGSIAIGAVFAITIIALACFPTRKRGSAGRKPSAIKTRPPGDGGQRRTAL